MLLPQKSSLHYFQDVDNVAVTKLITTIPFEGNALPEIRDDEGLRFLRETGNLDRVSDHGNSRRLDCEKIS